MYNPRFQRTDALIAMISRIEAEAARVVILRASVAARWESQLRHEALVRSAHHSTSIEGNPLSLEEVTDLLAGREVTALDLNARQIRALEFLSREPRMTTILYSQWNRVSRATAQRDLADLVARGLLRQRGVGRGIYYVLPQADEAQTPSDEAQNEAQNTRRAGGRSS
ncbi:MAG: hypothetical protein A2Z04_06895 [Chloroflexi bacterium RBG_16_57_9]|nr:MAG: hypothetical protein A2Z04_06895 [Chloroflexi bacterium RBG_16_57_9]